MNNSKASIPKFVQITALVVVAIVGFLTYLLPLKSSATQADLSISVADAGIQDFDSSGLPTNSSVRVEDFNSQTVRYNSEFSFSGSAGTWAGPGYILPADVYGGAGGSGNYAAAHNATLVLEMPEAGVDYRYVGFWWSAGNAQNYIELVEEDGTVVSTFSAADLAAVVGNCGDTPPTNGFCGNPNSVIAGTTYESRAVAGELFAFIHLRYAPGFRKVQFSGQGFEFDNLTVSQIVPDVSPFETFAETYDPYTLSAPNTIPYDPRDTYLHFPGISLGGGSGENDALLCITEVTDASGLYELEYPTVQIFTNSPNESYLLSGATYYISGLKQTILDVASETVFESSWEFGPLGISNSRYFRVSVTPQINIGISACTGSYADSEVFEVRPQVLFQSDLNEVHLGGG